MILVILLIIFLLIIYSSCRISGKISKEETNEYFLKMGGGKIMAKCEYCGKGMLERDGCDIDQLIMNDDKAYDRIAVGDDKDLYAETDDKKLRCHDCNALNGCFHHSGCDCETCPKSNEQLLSCDC